MWRFLFAIIWEKFVVTKFRNEALSTYYKNIANIFAIRRLSRIHWTTGTCQKFIAREFKLFYNTVESSIFVVDQCSWLLCVALSRIHIPTNLYIIICLKFIKFILITLPTKLRPQEPGKFWLPMNVNPTNKNDSTVSI